MIVAAKTDFYFSVAPMLSGRRSNTPQQIILASIEQNDPAKADFLKKQIDEANEVITQLRSSKSNMAKSAKAAAEEKVRRIKEEMKILRMMGGDTKMIAKQIAQLSKELAVAAREYASGAAGAKSSPDSAAAVGTSSDTKMATTVQNDSTAGGSAALPAVSAVTVPGELASSGAKGENGESATPVITSKTPTDAVQDKKAQEDQKYVLRQQLIADIQNNAAEISSKTAAAEADRKFAQEVRILAAQLKLLARQQEQRLHKALDHSAVLEVAQTNQALSEAEKIVSGLLAQAISAAA